MISNLFTYLVSQKQIKFNNITIYQTPLNDILDYGIDEYNMLLLPFLFDIDSFDIPNDLIAQEMNIFDILILAEDTFSMLLNSISFFCKTQEIAFDEQKGVLYVCDGQIERNNFAEFADIILKMNAKQKPEIEKPPANMTKKQEEIWRKLHEGRQRAIAKSQIDLSDLINVCQFGGNYYIPFNDISQWTMFNITRCYKTIIGKSSYQDTFDIYCVTGEEKLIKNRHWTELIKIDDLKVDETMM